MTILNRALRTSGANAERSLDRGDRFVPSSAGGVFHGSKRTCADRARWRLVRGQPAQRLSIHYQLECDYGMSILTIYNEGDPVFLCESHVSALTPRDSCIAGVRPIEASAKVDADYDAPGSGDRTPALSTATTATGCDSNLNATVAVSGPDPAGDQQSHACEERAEPVQPAALSAIPSLEDIADSHPADRKDLPGAPDIALVKPSAQTEAEQVPARPSVRTRRDATVMISKPAARDLAYGNPAKALVDETIWNMAAGDLDAYRNALEQGKRPLEAAQAAGGQLAVIHRKISEYTAKIEPMLSASKASISVGYAIDKPLEQAILEVIGSHAMAEPEKDAAVAHLGALQEQIKGGLGREITPLQAHRIAREIGERANWGRGSELHEEVKHAYRAVYTRLRDALRAFVPEARELDERLANLYAAKSDLEDAPPPKALYSATA